MKLYPALRTAAILLALSAIPHPVRANLADEWAQWELGTLGLSLELPGEPKMRKFPLSGPTQQIVEDHMGYFYGNQQIGVAVIYILVKSGAQREISRAPSIIAGVAIAGLAAGPGVSNVRSSVEEQGSKAIMRASFDQHGVRKEVEGVVFMSGRRLWAVVTSHVQGDEEGRASTRRVLDSVRQKTK